MGSGEVVVVRNETKRFPSFQPLSSVFVQLCFTLQAIVEGEFVLSGFEVEL